MNAKVAVAKCDSYESILVQQAVRQSVDLIGGISSIVKRGSRVLIKPNLLMAKNPEAGITTHPEVIRAVIKLLKENNCRVMLGDSPSVWDRYSEKVDWVYEVTGVKKVCAEEDVELVKFDRRRWRRNKFPLAAILDECDCLVNVPKFKTHGLTILTGAIKNNFGLVAGSYKTELHKKYFRMEDLSRVIVDIFEEVTPCLNIVDGIMAMEGDGPGTSGKLRKIGLLFAGTDGVAVDSVLAKVMGIAPTDCLTTKEASRRGLGVSDLDSISILGENLDNIIGKPFKIPSTSLLRRHIPEPVINLARRLIKFYPCVEYDNCVKCASCIKACPQKAISIKNGKVVIDHSGCIACFCCQEVCPEKAIKIKKSIFAKIIGL
ncbi:MAG: DUF362 domain-containing protein [Candidatus Omnitrophica bacterium]|nr:DUF362 domain-containing protein [Candidatus Omnitrophota bacterium]